jgi:FKBP-type peptidyl-prolyl cis-trans isomerase
MNGDLVRIHYEAILTATKKVIETTVTRGEPRAIVVGKDKVAKGLMKGVLAMKKGMKIKLTVAPQFAYGTNGIPGVVPPDSEIDYII